MKKKSSYVIPFGITIMIIIIAYCVNGVFPFGDKTISRGDLPQLFTTNLTFYINNIRNLNFSGFLFTNLVYGGERIIGSAILSGYLGIFSIFYLLCSNPDNLLDFMSYVFLIKAGLSAVTSFYCFNKLLGYDNYKNNIVFSVLYALSAYVIINYSTIMWLDIVLLFPLYIVAYKNILDNKGFIKYSIILAICILTSYQLAFMILFFTVIATVVALHYYIKENKKEIILKLGIATILAVTSVSALFLPVVSNYFSSFRNELDVEKNNREVFSTKIAHLFFSSILFWGLLSSFKYGKKDKNIKQLLLIIAFTGIIPILFDGVNKIWHGGNYDSFPFRQGFIPLFFINLLTNYYIKNYFDKQKSKDIKMWQAVRVVMATIIAFWLITRPIKMYDTAFAILSENTVYFAWYCFATYGFIYPYFNKKSIMYVIALFEVLILSINVITLPDSARISRKHQDEPLYNAIMVKNNILNEMDYDDNYKYKDEDGFFTENSSFVTQKPSNSSWIFTEKKQILDHRLLGYSTVDMRLDSSGGTVLSDAILNVKYVFINDKLNSDLYKLEKSQNDNIYIYSLNHNLPIGIVYDGSKSLNIENSNMNKVKIQNFIYQNLLNGENDIFREIKNNYHKKFQDGKEEIDCVLNVEGKKIIYAFYEDGQKVILHLIDETDDGEAKKQVNVGDYFKELGLFNDSQVKIRIENSNKLKIEKLKFFELDYDKYLDIFDNIKNTQYSLDNKIITINVKDVENDKKLFVPLNYNKELIVKVNNETVEPERALNSMVSIPLKEGDNNITITYLIPNFKIGIVLSVGSLILLIVFYLLKDTIFKNRLLNNIAYYTFYGLSCLIVASYVILIIKDIVLLVKNNV